MSDHRRGHTGLQVAEGLGPLGARGSGGSAEHDHELGPHIHGRSEKIEPNVGGWLHFGHLYVKENE